MSYANERVQALVLRNLNNIAWREHISMIEFNEMQIITTYPLIL